MKYISNSGNKKIQGSFKVDATYASIAKTCPSTCALKNGAGCYAELGKVAMHLKKFEETFPKGSRLQMAQFEADAIDEAYEGGLIPKNRYLRLHVSGDTTTVNGARAINGAVGRWMARGGKRAWSYTHAWRQVKRAHWNKVSMLASLDSVSEVDAAREQGYAPAIVVSEFESPKAFRVVGSDTEFIPCPAQTKGVGCTDCQLCMKADWLHATNRGIAFEAHGPRKKMMKANIENTGKRHLSVIQ